MELHPLILTTIALLDILAILGALWRTQGVERTLMWVFAIIAFPGVGALAYLALANPSVTRTSRKKRAASIPLCEQLGKPDCLSPTPKTSPLASLASNVTGLPATGGNRVDVLPEPPHAFDLVMLEIKKAKKSIWAEFYIISSDETGARFLKQLTQSARNGVEVRLLFDAVGSLSIDMALLEELKNAGGKVEAFHPLSPFRRRWSVHLRNHRKLVIIDGRVALTGSMNVGNEYSWRFLKRGMSRFIDTHLLIEGPAVAGFEAIFADDWSFAVDEQLSIRLNEEPKSPGHATVAALPSGPDQTHNASALLYFGGITSATKRLYIITPYFIPDEAIVRALQFAALKGVDVRLLVPKSCDALLVGPAGRSYFPALIASGVRIYQYLPSMLHAKTMIIDDEISVVGSANLDIRSIRLNFELGVLVDDRAFNDSLARRFFASLEKSSEVTARTLSNRSILVQMLERGARLLSPIL